MSNDTPFAIIIFGLMAAVLFILAFFSICIRECSDEHSSTRPHIPRHVTAVRSPGLDNNVVRAFPTFLYSEVKHLKFGKHALECAVCLNEFEDVETLRLLPKCDHVFHPECIDVWLSSHTTCPVCRADLAQSDSQGVVNLPSESDPISTTIEVVEDETVSDRSSPIRSTMWSKFPRSHSTGHSLIQPGENVDRFTLKLPDQIRNEILNRALNQSTSLSVSILPGESSSKKGYRESYRRLGSLDRSGRWMFKIAPPPPFFSRESSVRQSNRGASGSESEGTSKGFNLVRRLSFNRFGGSKSGEPTLIDAV